MRRIRKRVVVLINYRGLMRIAAGGIAVLFIGLLLTQEIPASQTWTFWTLPLSGKVIAIDAGHGGVDGGASSKEGAIEKDLNLAIALYVRDYLQQAGALVIMTREEDIDLAEEGTRGYSKRKTEDLKRRVAMIQEKKPDLLISIHMNSIPSPKWSGAQTFYYPGSTEGARLADLIQEEIKRNMENTSRVANAVDSIYLLKALQELPVALVEVGFLSNPGEARQLSSADYQRKIAASIYQGVLRFSIDEKKAQSSSGM
jgi:N-acetylmuramoyl-L-alanine amidase